MTNPESFNDQALATFLDAAAQQSAEYEENARQQAVIHNRLWSAIETLEIETVMGSDPTKYKQKFNALIAILHEETGSDQANEDPELTDQKIRMMAACIWDSESDILLGLSLALQNQIFPDLPHDDKSKIKKQFMARLIANEDNATEWLQLADFVLEGESLDTSRPDDMEIITQELEIAANLNTTPEAILYDQIAEIFELVDCDIEKLDPKERHRVEVLTMATRDITEAACVLAGDETQPDRHEWIHGLLRRYGITDPAHISTIISLTDKFAPAE